MENEQLNRQEKLENTIVNMAAEDWRFSRLFSRLLKKLDAGEGSRYSNQHRFFLKSLDENLKSIGYCIVNIEGQPYDVGMAATALNLDDFNPEEQLIVDNMIEPIIIGPDGVIKSGTVMLRRA